MSAHEQNHQFHLVEPSPWPAVGAAGGLVSTLGGVMYMHDKPFGGYIAIIGILLILMTMYFWWRDLVWEATYQGHHKPVVQIAMRYGMVLFIASEVMFFVAFFWAFFDSSLYPDQGVWPPPGVEVFAPFDIPLINTMILLLSGCTVTWAHAALLKDDQKNMVRGLGVTILLGISFTALQIYEYQHAAFGFKDGIYSSTFYMATGFHGFHVLVGTIFLIVCYFRGRAGHFKPEHHFGFEAAAWYWHFVDVVWLFLFICIYWWGG
jgi:heme/copper-type cytochrome/quinol oxidase subunit 3